MTRFLGNIAALVALGLAALWAIGQIGFVVPALPDLACLLAGVDPLLQLLFYAGFFIGLGIWMVSGFKAAAGLGLMFIAGILEVIRFEWIAPIFASCRP